MFEVFFSMDCLAGLIDFFVDIFFEDCDMSRNRGLTSALKSTGVFWGPPFSISLKRASSFSKSSSSSRLTESLLKSSLLETLLSSFFFFFFFLFLSFYGLGLGFNSFFLLDYFCS